MATKNIVPRANGEGGIGTAAKGWGGAFLQVQQQVALLPEQNYN